MKVCRTCHSPLATDQFYRSSMTRDGLRSSCKRCEIARTRRWQRENADRHRANKRRWQQSPNGQASARRYRHENVAYHRERQRQWREVNREYDLARKNTWMAQQGNYRRRLRFDGQFIEEVDREILYQMYGGLCGICREPICCNDFHIDHIIPLSRGGSHGYGNCQPTHPRCNLQKGAKIEERVL